MLSTIQFALKYGGMVLKFGPILVGVVRAVEEIRNGVVSGAQKKEIAMTTVEKILTVFGYKMTEEIRKMLDHAIELVVAALTFRGELQHKGKEAVLIEVKPHELPLQVVNVSEQVLTNERQLDKLRQLMGR
jgi:hypothetical protein